MSGSYLLDTNAAIAYLEGDTALTDVLADEDEVYVSLVTIGELHYGAEKSSRFEENRRRIHGLVNDCVVLLPSLETAHWYGSVKNGLRQKGRPVPENDIWIAAIGLEYGLTVLNRDRHFDEVDGLSQASW